MTAEGKPLFEFGMVDEENAVFFNEINGAYELN